jgi:hypothetical protein
LEKTDEDHSEEGPPTDIPPPIEQPEEHMEGDNGEDEKDLDSVTGLDEHEDDEEDEEDDEEDEKEDEEGMSPPANGIKILY